MHTVFSGLFRGVVVRKLSIIVSASLILSAFSSVGPQTIERDQLDYGNTLNNALNQQLLANIVRLRYMEAPMFVDVSSVINQYAVIANVNAQAGINNAFGGDSNAATLGAGGRYEDRPTITYTPISGKKFAQSLLTPIPPESLFALVQSGWPAEILFRLTVSSMNGVEDANPPRRQADPKFRQVMAAWSRLRDARVIGLRRSAGPGDKPKIVLYISNMTLDPETEKDLKFLLDTLELDPNSREFSLTYGLIPDQPDEIAVLTASILDIMVDLAWQIRVPDEHVEERRAGPTFADTSLGGSMFTVQSSKEKPEMPFVAFYNRGYWFWIDDRDLVSKRTFGILQILLSLTDTEGSARGPVVTIGGG